MDIGDSATLTRRITEDDINHIVSIIPDENPLHFEDGFAIYQGFRGRIAHGLFSFGLISAVIGTKLPGPGSIYLHQDISFLNPVYPGDTLIATVKVLKLNKEKGIYTLETECHTENGVKIVEGQASVLLRHKTYERRPDEEDS